MEIFFGLDEPVVSIHFIHPILLWTIPAAIAVIAVATYLSRSGLGRTGRIVTTSVRTVAILAILVALAEPVAERTLVDGVQTRLVILEDHSLSVGNDPAALQASQSVVAAKDLPYERIQFAGQSWKPGQAGLQTDQTDIQSALDHISDSGNNLAGLQVVVLTDGRSTRGIPSQAAARLAMRGAKVHVLPVGERRQQPPRITDIQPPLGAAAGTPAALRVTLDSDQPSKGILRLIDPARHVVDQQAMPIAGQSTLILHFVPSESGLRNYNLELDVDGKLADSQVVPLYVAGAPRILIADPVPEESLLLSKAIAGLHMPVDVVAPDKWPSDLGQYAVVAISDFSGNELSPDQRGELRRFVEVDGGGLVFVGGSNVVASRWQTNPLRLLLPVEIRRQPVKVIKRMPDVSVVFVVDRSGSMRAVLPGSAGNVSKLEMVKAAIIASMQALPESSRIAVIAFGDEPHLIAPPTSIKERAGIGAKIDAIGIGGGTNMFPAIQEGLKTLQSMGGDKYLIVLTDGQSEPPGGGSQWADLPREAISAGISWTSVGVGTDADEVLLRGLAGNAGGRYAHCDTGDQIPQVFVNRAKEIRRASETPQESFIPTVGPDVANWNAADLAGLPSLLGHVPADARQNVQIALLAKGNDPLLASWQFGAGRVVAFCSDWKNMWAKKWLDSPAYPKFWTAVIASVAHPRPPLFASVTSDRQGDKISLIYHVHDANGLPVEDLDTHATVNPAIPAAPVWKYLQPGAYQLSISLPDDSRQYAVDVRIRKDLRQSVQQRLMLTGTGGSELSATGPDLIACEEIAAAGDGICSTEPGLIASIVRAPEPSRMIVHRRRLWPWLVMLAVCLWPVDVLLRKLL